MFQELTVILTPLKTAWIKARKYIPRIKYGRRWAAGSVLFVILMILLCQKDNPSQTVHRDEWHVVRSGPFIVDLVESGEVEALSKRSITTPMMWSSNMQIIDLVPEGTLVDSGDFLIQFDASDLEERYALNEENIASLKADLQRTLAQQERRISELENNLTLAEYSREQAELTLKSQQYESDTRKEEARIQLNQAGLQLETTRKMLDAQRIINKSELMRIRTSIRQAESDQAVTRERIDQMQLTATAKGMVVYEEVGQRNARERLRAGYTARPGEALITIPDLADMRVKAFVNEVDRARVFRGQKADIWLDAYPDTSFSGEVTEVARLAQMLEYEDNLKGFAIYVDIHGTDRRLKPGMTARVRIRLKEYDDVLSIPLGTVFEEDGQPVVFKGSGRERAFVEIGERNDASVIIKEGLREGDRVSWTPPEDEEVQILGYRNEQQRIQDLAAALRESFDEFKSRGILFDYFDTAAGKRGTEGADKRAPEPGQTRPEWGKGAGQRRGSPPGQQQEGFHPRQNSPGRSAQPREASPRARDGDE